jgi:translation initiation factor IF-2
MTGEGLGDMIEGLILQSEVMDLRACKDSRAEGLIIDAKVSVPVLIIHSFTFARGAMIQ